MDTGADEKGYEETFPERVQSSVARVLFQGGEAARLSKTFASPEGALSGPRTGAIPSTNSSEEDFSGSALERSDII